MRRILFLLVLFAACGRPQTMREIVRPAAQWTATLQVTGDRWLADAVPPSFVRDAVADADKTIETTALRVMSSDAPRAERVEVGRALEIAREAAGDFRDAVERRDRAGVASAIRRFAAAHARLQQVR